MLNALRHQRFGHKGILPQCKHLELCSTPYGIKGLGISIRKRRIETSPMLNALRHQRFGHTYTWQWYYSGIEMLNALRHQRFGHIAL